MTSDEAGPDEPSDFVSELYLLVVEEEWLWEVGGAVTDFSPDGDHVVHGPWDPAECSRRPPARRDSGSTDSVRSAAIASLYSRQLITTISFRLSALTQHFALSTRHSYLGAIFTLDTSSSKRLITYPSSFFSSERSC